MIDFVRCGVEEQCGSPSRVFTYESGDDEAQNLIGLAGRYIAEILSLASLLGRTLSIGGPLAAQRPGPDGTFYISTYTDQIRVLDERTFEVVDLIETQHGIPGRFVVSQNRERLYVSDATGEHIEVIELAESRSTDSFTLSKGNEQFRFRSFDVDPQETYVLMIGKTTTKLPDRFEVGSSVIVRYDLRNQEVMDTIPWPDGHARQSGNFMFSPDGKLVYFSAEDMIVLDSETFTEVDRWEISRELEPGLGRIRPGFSASYYEESGFFTGLVRITDPINNRRMMGIARVNLAEKDMQFYTLGPSQPVGQFALAPGGEKAWGLYSEVGHYEFWAFDLRNRQVSTRREFAGRPRMGLLTSTDGELLYIHVAGNTIDVYDSDTYDLLRTVDVGGDMRGFVLLPGSDGP